MLSYRSIRTVAGRKVRALRYRRTYDRFRQFTMISPETYINNLLLAEQAFKVSGCVVECGVWRGGMVAGLATVMGLQRRYFLFDSFEGLPPAKTIDGEAAQRWQRNTHSPTYHDNCSAAPEYASRAMNLAGVQSFELIKGWFDKTLPTFCPSEPIALLRLDCDWYDSTITCLDFLFDRVAEGGMIIIDDYYTWDGCSRALHDFLSRRSAVERIHGNAEICYLKKLAPSRKT